MFYRLFYNLNHFSFQVVGGDSQREIQRLQDFDRATGGPPSAKASPGKAATETYNGRETTLERSWQRMVTVNFLGQNSENYNTSDSCTFEMSCTWNVRTKNTKSKTNKECIHDRVQCYFLPSGPASAACYHIKGGAEILFSDWKAKHNGRLSLSRELNLWVAPTLIVALFLPFCTFLTFLNL